MRTNITPLMYTCSRMLPLIKIFKRYWLNVNFGGKTIITSNNFDGYTEFDYDNFEYVTPNIPFESSGNHFRQTMLHALDKITTKYIFFVLDDYIFLQAKWDRVDVLVEHMNRHDIKFCGLSSIVDLFATPAPDESPDLGITSDWAVTLPDDYLHKYSVQPCIWEVETLRNLLVNNIRINAHALDTANLEYDPKFKHMATLKRTTPIVPGWNPNDFIIQYVEMIRWGYFNECETTFEVPFIRGLLEEFGIKNEGQYQQFYLPTGKYYAG